MIRRALLSASLAAVMSTGFVVAPGLAPAYAQTEDDRRLDRIEKQVRELRAIVFQGRDTGQPVTVKPEGPDPEVTALQQRVSDIDETIRKLNGQIEVLTHDADEARAAANAVRDQNGELRGQLKDLTDRVAKLEAMLSPASAAPPATGQAAPGQPSATGVLTLPPGYSGSQAPAAEAPPAPPSPAEQYKHARALLAANEFPAATVAFQAFIAQNPNFGDIAGAYYWLGEADSARQAFADAVPAYANALKGWPKSAWAGEATVSLARALAMSGQTDKACAALSEFDRRYRPHASTLVKKRALDVRSRANCAG